jgi:hypothetical protein
MAGERSGRGRGTGTPPDPLQGRFPASGTVLAGRDLQVFSHVNHGRGFSRVAATLIRAATP